MENWSLYSGVTVCNIAIQNIRPQGGLAGYGPYKVSSIAGKNERKQCDGTGRNTGATFRNSPSQAWIVSVYSGVRPPDTLIVQAVACGHGRG